MAEEPQPEVQEACAHLAELDERERKDLVKHYRTVVSWYFNRVHDAFHHPPAKRRKVC